MSLLLDNLFLWFFTVSLSNVDFSVYCLICRKWKKTKGLENSCQSLPCCVAACSYPLFFTRTSSLFLLPLVFVSLSCRLFSCFFSVSPSCPASCLCLSWVCCLLFYPSFKRVMFNHDFSFYAIFFGLFLESFIEFFTSQSCLP